MMGKGGKMSLVKKGREERPCSASWQFFLLIFFLLFSSSFSAVQLSLQALRGEQVAVTLYSPAVFPSEGSPLLIGEMPKGVAQFFAEKGFAVVEVHSIIQRLRSLYSPDEEVLSFYRQILGQAESVVPINRKRVGVLGGSGGGIFSYRLCGLVPDIAASVPMAAPHDPLKLLSSHQTVMLAKGLGLLGIVRTVSLAEPLYIRKVAKRAADVLGKMLTEGTVSSYYDPDVYHAVSPRDYVAKSRCPTLIINSWHDFFMRFDPAWENYRALSVPKKLLMSEGAHGSEIRPAEMGFQLAKALLWLEHFLQGRENGVEKEPPLLLSLPGSEHPFRKGEMEHLYLEQFPPPDQVIRQFYFRASGKLEASPPLRREQILMVNGLEEPLPANAEDFLLQMVFRLLPKEVRSQLPKPEELRKMPVFQGVLRIFQKFLLPLKKNLAGLEHPEGRVRFEYRTAPLARSRLLLGTPKVSLDLVPEEGHFQIHALLYDVGRGKESLISRASYTSEEAKKGRLQHLEFPLETTFYRIPKGDQLKLVLKSTDFPTALPQFKKFSFSLEVGDRSYLSLPFLERALRAPSAPVGLRVKVRQGRRWLTWKQKGRVRGFLVYAPERPVFLGKGERKKNEAVRKVLEALKRDRILFAGGWREMAFLPYPADAFLLGKREGKLAVAALSLEGVEGPAKEIEVGAP